MILPVIVLAAWTMVMWAWMLITRIPAIFKARIKLDPYAKRGEQMAQLPAEVRWKADNYNHLFEQPTIFYAVALAMVQMGQTGQLNSRLAWSYVILRIVHGLVQATWNNIEVRFALFLFSSLPLIWLIINALISAG